VLDHAIRSLLPVLSGVVATEADIRLLTSCLEGRLVPAWFLSMLRTYRLAGTCLTLEDEADESGLGVELIWLTPPQVISEATECQPGLSVVPQGYIPIGACAVGSGDPYFLDMRGGETDPPLVRVPHDFAVHARYPLDRIERVTTTLSGFFAKATCS
jgi:hypothetical protein